MIKKVFKFETGQDIPEGAVYLSTQVETESYKYFAGDHTERIVVENRLVWHYFLVEVK